MKDNKQMTQKDPNTRDAWSKITRLFEEARSHYYKEEHEQAVQKYNEVLEMQLLSSVEEGTVRCELGYALFGAGAYEQAVHESLSALSLNPSIEKTYGVHNTMGSSFLHLNKFEDAIAAHKKAIENSSSDEQRLRSSYQLGRSFLLNERPEEALEMFQTCLDLVETDDLETNLDIQYNLGFTYAHLDKRFNSERAFRTLLKDARNPSDVARGYFGLMQLHVGLEDYAQVIEFGKRVLEEQPDFPDKEIVLQGLVTAAAKTGQNNFTKLWDDKS